MRQVESEEGCLIIDDTIVEKQWTDENEVVCWHYDHSKGRNVKGFNIVNLLYHSNGISIPVGFEVVKKLREGYHKSLKFNAAVTKSPTIAKFPTKRVTTPMSHLVMSMIGVFKLECLKIKHHLNHFAHRAKVLIKANLAAMSDLKKLCCA